MNCSALAGRRILAVDGSAIRGPSAITSSWRLHYALDIGTLACHEMEITDGKVGESLSRFAVQKEDVIVADRGFANRRGVNHVLDRAGDIVVRINLSSLPLQDEAGQPFVQLAHLTSLKMVQSGEWPATMQGQGTNESIAVRVCAYRKNEIQRAESERKYYQYLNKKQQKFQADTVAATGYVVLLTRLKGPNAEAILALYRHRWQIELAFKRMKSLLGLGHLKKKDAEGAKGAKAWLQGKLLVACLIEWLIALDDHFSPLGPTQHEEKSYETSLPVA